MEISWILGKRKSKHMCRKLFSVLLTCSLAVGMLPGTVLPTYAEEPYDDPGKFCIVIYDDSEDDSNDWTGIDTEGIQDPDSGSDLNGNLLDQPYWKNDPDHDGKLIYGTADDYNLKYDSGTLYLNGLNLKVNGSETANAIYTNVDLNIVVEADSAIECSDECAIVGEKTVTFSGNANLTITSTGSEDKAALIAGENVTNQLNGTITLNSAGNAEGLWWLNDPCEVLGSGNWAGDPLMPEDSDENIYDAPGKFCIVIYDDSENDSNDWTGIDTEGIQDPDSGDELIGNLLDQPYWKNDPDHDGKLIYGTADDYNLKYDSGTLYLNGLNLKVNGSETANAIYTNVDLNIVVEADSAIECSDECAIVGEKTVTFSGNANLTITSTGSEDKAALIAGENVTNQLNGTITLNSAGNAEGLWWLNDPCEVLGSGNWAGTPLTWEDSDDDWVERDNYTDNELHVGYAGCYLTEKEYKDAEICWGGSPEDMEGYAPLLWVHGSTIQEVIDKLSGTKPITVYDNEGRISDRTVADLRTDYIRICVSVSNYAVQPEHVEEQYITSTRGFKGIFIQGGYDKQMTNHPRRDDGYYVEDVVREVTDEVRDTINMLATSYGLDLNGIALNNVAYISEYDGGIYVANERNSIDADHPYQFDIDFDSYITSVGEIETAIWGEHGYYSDHDTPPDGEPDLYTKILGEDNELHVNLPFKTIHINSDCDFKIAGMWNENLAAPSNPEGINIYFGFLPDTNHSISFVVDNEDGDGWHEVSYTKNDLRNPLRDILIFSPGATIDRTDIKVLMYQHVTSGTITGNYKETVTMENIPDAKLLRNAELTEAQLDVLENAGSVDINLSVNQLNTQSKEVQAAVTDITKELERNNYICENPVYLDLSMSALIRNSKDESLSFQNGVNSLPLTELSEPVELTVTVPEQIRTSGSNREYEVVRRHIATDGSIQTEILQTKYDSKTNSLTFVTDQFSTYAIVYKDTAMSDGNTKTEGSTPVTGDSAPIGMQILLLCLACGCFVGMKWKNRKML